MNTQEYIDFIPKYFDKIKNDGYKKNTIWVNHWILNSFKHYCLSNKIIKIDMEVLKKFYNDIFQFDINNTTTRYQTVLRRPLLALMSYYNDKLIPKRFDKKKDIMVGNKYRDIFEQYKSEIIETTELSDGSKKRKIRVVAELFNYLEIKKIDNITFEVINEYLNIITNKYINSAACCYKSIIRELLNWMYKCKAISISGDMVIPKLHRTRKSNIISSYSKEELEKMLDAIDINTKSGKFFYSIMTMLIYLGIRIGDILNLKFENIDWENNTITFIQNKTKNQLILPLIDEVKYPLIDYIKNGRNKSKDQEYIYSTINAPYTKCKRSNIYNMIVKIMDKTSIDYSNRHHGPHAFRHSLATNMINDNVPIEIVSEILGHAKMETTDIYITKDINHLKELTLEVLLIAK